MKKKVWIIPKMSFLLTTLQACVKCFLLIFLLSINSVSIYAQIDNTMIIRGVTIDKNGNPIKGITIEAAGGLNSTETAEDGTFSMEVSRWLKSVTASAPGMHNKTIILNGTNEKPLVFKMKEDKKYNPKHLKGNMTLHGTIVDNNGNPLPGAKIDAKGTNLNTITDADGSFSIEIPRSLRKIIISYPGLHKTTVYLHGRADNPLVLKIGKHSSGIINVNGNFSLF